MPRCICATRRISPDRRWRRSNVAGRLPRGGRTPAPGSASGLLQHVPGVLHACPDCGANLGWAGERGDDPGPGIVGVAPAHGLGRRRAALLQVGFVFLRRAVALNGGIVRRSAPAEAKQQGGNEQADSEGSHAPDGRKPDAIAPAPSRGPGSGGRNHSGQPPSRLRPAPWHGSSPDIIGARTSRRI